MVFDVLQVVGKTSSKMTPKVDEVFPKGRGGEVFPGQSGSMPFSLLSRDYLSDKVLFVFFFRLVRLKNLVHRQQQKLTFRIKESEPPPDILAGIKANEITEKVRHYDSYSLIKRDEFDGTKTQGIVHKSTQ